MSRPLTKGATIGVQLPLDVDTAVRAAALSAGVTPGAYIAGVVSRASHPVSPSLFEAVPPVTVPPIEPPVHPAAPTERTFAPTVARRLSAVPPKAETEATCVHRIPRKLPMGVWVCDACGMTSRDRGVTWAGF